MAGTRRALPIATNLLTLLLCAQPSVSAEIAQETGRPTETKSDGVISRIEFSGLQRIPAATLRSRLSTKPGEAPDPAKIERDVRALEGTGWFDSVRVELEELPVLLAYVGDLRKEPQDAEATLLGQGAIVFRLLFVVMEKPFLSKVEFRGGQLLRRDQIHQLLSARGIVLKTRMPCNRTEMWRAARALEVALAEMGHPKAQVRVRLQEIPTAAVRATFVIDEGPKVEVAGISFMGNESFSERRLRKQMRDVAPDAFLGALRGKTVYTRERIARDLERLIQFYRNYGYVEARIGEPEVEYSEARVRQWFFWPREKTKDVMRVRIPIQEGVAYRLGRADLEGASEAVQEKAVSLLGSLKPQALYSEGRILRVKEAVQRLEEAECARREAPRPQVDVALKLERSAASIRVVFRVHEAPQYTVGRIEFAGHHRFSDRYYRRRIALNEGEVFNPTKLEQGLRHLASDGFVRPVKSENFQIKLDDERRTANIRIRVEEIGRQRMSLLGGGAGSASTLGIAYQVFNLLGGEELLTTHIEGGPESVHILLRLAKEGVFGTRASFGLSLFQNIVQPRLGGQGRLFRARSKGLSATYRLPLTEQDTLKVIYEVSHSETKYTSRSAVLLPAGIVGELAAKAMRSEVALDWVHDSGRQRVDVSASVSGGRLGGTDNVLRSSLAFSRLEADPLTRGRNSLAFRGSWTGTSSFGDRTLPLASRLFDGDNLVRGFRRGGLGPYILVRQAKPDGTTEVRGDLSGANLVVAANAEYRVPLEAHTEVAAFADGGTGWLLPHWLGGPRPEILEGTNGILRSSAGIEVRVRLPVLNQTVRVYYAANPLRFARAIMLPGGVAVRPDEGRQTLGWGLGTFF